MRARVQPWLLAPVAAVVLLLHAAHYGTTWTDDAYITFRYARNFAAGQGMAFNPGERVEGLTNLGWALILTPFAGGDLLTVSQALGVLAGVATVAVFAAWARREALGAVATGVGLATLVVCPWLPLWMVQGLETPVVTLLLTLGWSRYRTEVGAERGPLLAAPALGLAPWLRPDAALLPLVLGVWHLACRGTRGGRAVRRSVVIVSVLGALLLAVKLAWFGALLPTSFHIKVDHFPPDRGTVYLAHFFSVPSAVLPALLFAALLVGAGWARRRDDRAIPSLVFGAYLVAAWAQNGDFMPNYRLLVPAWPAGCAALALTTQALLGRLQAGRGGAARRAVALGSLAIIGLSGFALVPQANTFYLDDLNRYATREHRPMLPPDKTVPLLSPWASRRWGKAPIAQVPYPAAWALVHAGVDEAVAYTELGLLSYVHDGPVVDLLGLTDRVMSGIDGDGWKEQRAYLAERLSWLIVNTGSGAWPRWSEALAEDGWPLVAGCGPTWVFQNPGKVPSPPSAAEVERRLAKALARAPRHDALHEGIARELGHAGTPPAAVSRYVDALEQLRHGPDPTEGGLRCDLGLTAGCVQQDTQCETGKTRLVVADFADPAAWPAPVSELVPPSAAGAPGLPAAAVAVAHPSGAASAECIAARTRASVAWRDARTAWAAGRGALLDPSETDEARRRARVASTAVHAGGPAARAAVAEAVAAARAVVGAPEAAGASHAAATASQAAATACGE